MPDPSDLRDDLLRAGDPDAAEPPAPPAGALAPELPEPELADLLARAELGFTDRANARRLAAAFGEAVIYVPGKGWAVRDAARYSFRAGAERANALAQLLADLVRQEADAVQRHRPVADWEAKAHHKAELQRPESKRRYGDLDKAADWVRRDKAAELRAWAVKCESKARIAAALEMAAPHAVVDVEDLDRDPWSLTVPNGRVDLRAAAAEDFEGCDDALELEARAAWLLPQDWRSYPTKCAGAPYDPRAEAPRWRAFLELILPDPGVRAFFQRCMGLAVFGKNDAQACILLRGSGGNGKSTAMDAIQHALGTRDGYAAACKVDMFLVTRDSSPGAATPEEVDLPGARAMIASEPAATDTFSAKKIKAMTGGDRRPVRGLHQAQFFYSPSAVPIISFNRTPRIRDEDEGTRRRLHFIPFDAELHKLPEERRRKPEEVAAELRAEASGILNWLLDGFRAYRLDGLAPPDRVAELKRALMADADPVGQFLEACCEPRRGERVSVTELHKVFLAWCEETGGAPWSARALSAILVEKGLHKVKASNYFWEPLAWRRDDLTHRLRTVANDGHAPAVSEPAVDVPPGF